MGFSVSSVLDLSSCEMPLTGGTWEYIQNFHIDGCSHQAATPSRRGQHREVCHYRAFFALVIFISWGPGEKERPTGWWVWGGVRIVLYLLRWFSITPLCPKRPKCCLVSACLGNQVTARVLQITAKNPPKQPSTKIMKTNSSLLVSLQARGETC